MMAVVMERMLLLLSGFHTEREKAKGREIIRMKIAVRRIRMKIPLRRANSSYGFWKKCFHEIGAKQNQAENMFKSPPSPPIES